MSGIGVKSLLDDDCRITYQYRPSPSRLPGATSSHFQLFACIRSRNEMERLISLALVPTSLDHSIGSVHCTKGPCHFLKLLSLIVGSKGHSDVQVLLFLKVIANARFNFT